MREILIYNNFKQFTTEKELYVLCKLFDRSEYQMILDKYLFNKGIDKGDILDISFSTDRIKVLLKKPRRFLPDDQELVLAEEVLYEFSTSLREYKGRFTVIKNKNVIYIR